MERRLIDRWLFWDEMQKFYSRLHEDWIGFEDDNNPIWIGVINRHIDRNKELAEFCAKRKWNVEQDMLNALCEK